MAYGNSQFLIERIVALGGYDDFVPSTSVDDVRIWSMPRTAEQIGQFMCTPVPSGEAELQVNPDFETQGAHDVGPYALQGSNDTHGSAVYQTHPGGFQEGQGPGRALTDGGR